MRIASETRRPYRSLRLVLFAVGLLYILITIGTIHYGGLFSPVGVDFRAFFASARIAVTSGFPEVYHLAAQKEIQTALMAPYGSPEVEPGATFFLPAFILLLYPFLPPGLLGGLIAWIVLNLIILIGYSIWFLRSETGKPGEYSLLLAMALLSFPVLANFFFGQVNVWLLVCMGEFIRAWGEGKRVRGGLWLSGLLLKPQILVLMFPFLVFSGEWGIAGGFAIGAAAIGMISLVIGGTEGIKAWAALLTHHATRLPTTGPGIMINLRMVSELLSLLFSLDVQRIAGIVAIAIALLTLWFSLRLREQAPEEKLGVMVPLLAATFVTTWHAHMHMAMAFIPLLLHQVITGRMPLRLFGLWTMLPPAVYFLCVAGIVLLTVSGVQLPPIEGFTYPALVLLVLHLFLTVHCLRRKC